MMKSHHSIHLYFLFLLEVGVPYPNTWASSLFRARRRPTPMTRETREQRRCATSSLFFPMNKKGSAIIGSTTHPIPILPNHHRTFSTNQYIHQYPTTPNTKAKTMTSHPETKIDCSKVYVKQSTFSNDATGMFDGAFAAVSIKEGELIEKGVMRRLPEGFDGNTCPYIFTWSTERPNKVRLEEKRYINNNNIGVTSWRGRGVTYILCDM
jgi:hypothetical protein